MSISSVNNNALAAAGSALLQQLMAARTTGSGSSSGSVLGDLMDFSPASQELAQAPDAVMEAVDTLLAGKEDAQGDLASFLQQHPSSLTTILGSLQGGAGTYDASGSVAGANALVAALLSAQGSAPGRTSLLALLMSSQAQDPLLASLGNTQDGSADTAWSFLG